MERELQRCSRRRKGRRRKKKRSRKIESAFTTLQGKGSKELNSQLPYPRKGQTKVNGPVNSKHWNVNHQMREQRLPTSASSSASVPVFGIDASLSLKSLTVDGVFGIGTSQMLVSMTTTSSSSFDASSSSSPEAKRRRLPLFRRKTGMAAEFKTKKAEAMSSRQRKHRQ